MNRLEIKLKRRLRRKFHIRKKIKGTSERPRLTVTKTARHIYAQIIDDTVHRTLVSASTLDKEIREKIKPEMTKTELSKLIGAELAKRALNNNIDKVVFDRNGYLYHGRVKALAEAARENGLKF